MPKLFTKNVFLSATTADLASARKAVAGKLLKRGIVSEVEELFTPEPCELVGLIWQKIKSADAVICIVGFRFGAEPTGALIRSSPCPCPVCRLNEQQRNIRGPRAVASKVIAVKKRRSYTQLEYDFARKLRKRIYLFFAREGYPFDPVSIEEDADTRAFQLAHRRDLEETNYYRNPFATTDELVDRVGDIKFRSRLVNPATVSASCFMGLMAGFAYDGSLRRNVPPKANEWTTQIGITDTPTITGYFPKAINPKSASVTLTGPDGALAASIAYPDSEKKQLTITPKAPLRDAESYQVTILGPQGLVPIGWRDRQTFEFRTAERSQESLRQAVAYVQEEKKKTAFGSMSEVISKRYAGKRIVWTGLIGKGPNSHAFTLTPTEVQHPVLPNAAGANGAAEAKHKAFTVPKIAPAHFYFDPDRDPPAVKVGNEATIEGEISRYELYGFVINRCRLLSEGPSDAATPDAIKVGE